MSKCANESVAVCCNCRIALHQSVKQSAGSTRRAQPEASDLCENKTFKFARNQQRELRAASSCRAQPEASDLRENETFKFARSRQREL